MISHRGNTGGFELPRARRSASVLDVVEAIEGPLRLNVCLGSDSACERQAGCPAHNVWQGAQEAMASVLRGATVEALARETAEKS